MAEITSAAPFPSTGNIDKIELTDTSLKGQGFARDTSGNTGSNAQFQSRSQTERSRRGRNGNKNTIGLPGVEDLRRKEQRQQVGKQLRQEGERVITQEEQQFEPEACVRYLFQRNFGRTYQRISDDETVRNTLGNNRDRRRGRRGRRGGRGQGQQQQQIQQQQPLDDLKQQGVLQQPIQALDGNKPIDNNNIYNNIRPLGQGRRQRNRRRGWNNNNNNMRSENIKPTESASIEADKPISTEKANAGNSEVIANKLEEWRAQAADKLEQGKSLISQASDKLNDAMATGATSPKNRAPDAPKEAISEMTPMDAAKGVASSFAEQAGQMLTDIKDSAMSTLGLATNEPTTPDDNNNTAWKKDDSNIEKMEEGSSSVLESTKDMIVNAYEVVKEKTSDAIDFIAGQAESAGLTLEPSQTDDSNISDNSKSLDKPSSTDMSKERSKDEVLKRGYDAKEKDFDGVSINKNKAELASQNTNMPSMV